MTPASMTTLSTSSSSSPSPSPSSPSSSSLSSRTSDDYPSSSSTSILATLDLLTPEVCSLSPDDLELLENWCSTTYRSLTHDESCQEIWRDVITREALRHPALLDSMLSLSALQLAYHSWQDPLQEKFFNAAHSHWIKARAGLEHEVYHPNSASNDRALFGLCNVLMISAFGFASLVRSSLSTSSLDVLCQIFRHMRGPTKVLIDLIDTVEEGEMASLVTPGEADPMMPNTSALAILTLKSLNARQGGLGLQSRHTEKIYSQTIDQLGSCFSYSVRSSDPGIIVGFSWILRIPSGYLDLLAEYQPLALTILAHYCVVIYHLRQYWWMGDRGVRVLREICHLLGRDHLATINWAIDATGICLSEDLR